MKFILLAVTVVAVFVLLSMSIFTVDPSEFAYVTQFGEPIAMYDGGAADSEAGLHWRWPWPVQSVTRLDRRLQYFDLPVTEFPTHDPKADTVDKMLVVEAYVCWRILGKDKDALAVDRFIRRIGTPEQARIILGHAVNSAIGARIGQMRIDDLISTETERDKVTRKIDRTIENLRKSIREKLQPHMNNFYGIELVDLCLRRFNHPAQARNTILDRIKSERSKKAQEYRSEGDMQAKNIKSKAEADKRSLLAQALAEEKKLKGEAETEADQIRNAAQSEDPEFYVFLKKLEKMQSILGENKTLLLLSTHRPVFDLLFQPPGAGGMSATPGGGNNNGPNKNGPMPPPKTLPPGTNKVEKN